MLGIVIGGVIGVIAVIFVIVVSVKDIKSVKKQKFVCENCEKEFNPKASAASLYNFGDDSKVVECPHCGHRARMAPKG